jgi:hypothetical protein
VGWGGVEDLMSAGVTGLGLFLGGWAVSWLPFLFALVASPVSATVCRIFLQNKPWRI